MTLYDACSIGYFVPSTTIEDCIRYVKNNAIYIFYDSAEAVEEIKELEKEFAESNFTADDLAEDVIGYDAARDIDAAVRDALGG